jgi:hypothetical protein
MAQAPNLLTGQTPNGFTPPAGWTVTATENFEAGACAAGSFCGGNLVTTQFHNDGNNLHTHSIGCPVGGVPTANCIGSSTSWNKFLPTGTREVYVSWYQWLDSSFRMNDEFFLMRLHWDTGNGQPSFRENVFDYFQNSTGTYNSTNATLLMNIQGQPYYQNKLPLNTSDSNTNFTITTGRWVQHEMYQKFSTVGLSASVSGTVTVSGSAHTYTRSTGSWITDGVHVGDSPHFTGFSNSDNNGAGDSGGGGTSYFVTSVTATVMTVYDPTNRMSNEGPVGSLTMQIDHGDGAYAFYLDGVRVGFQNNMVNPGKVDFSTSNTTLSIGETYSKLIWHDQILKTDPNCIGGCQTDSGSTGCERMAPPYGNGTGVFTGSCMPSIGGGKCGYEFLPFGWNGAGLTRAGATGPFTEPITCDATWSGNMPTPPVFSRYIDDVIVLTKSTTAASSVSPAAITPSSDSCGSYQTITFPGYAKFKMGDGLGGVSCGMAGTSGQGMTDFWDLKNDPTAAVDYGCSDTGCFEHQWGIKNFNGTTRYNEVKEGPMAITVAESNNVRVKLTQTGPVRSVGLLSNTADCCMTISKSYVFYRHGTATGVGAAKVYTKTTMNYTGTDGLGPLTTAGTSTGINVYNKFGWWRVSGEVNNQTNQNGPCFGSSGLVPFTASPWTMQYQAPGTNANKDYILFAPVSANSATSGEFLQANTCISPGASPQGPTPALIHTCNTPSSSGCVSQSDNAAVVRTNFLQIENEQQCNYMTLASLAPYFGGGLRVYCALQNTATFNSNVPLSWTSAGFMGDNGITSTTLAAPFSTEYKTPPTMTLVTGTGGTFDPAEGYWTMTAASSTVSLSANGILHSPVFFVSSFSGALPTTIQVSGSTKTIDVDYVAVKTDSTHLLLEYLSDVAAGTPVQISSTAAPVALPLVLSPCCWTTTSSVQGQAVQQTFTLTNPGPLTDTVTFQMTQLPSNGSFSVIQNNCGTSVPAGVQCTFIIAFGGSTGQYTANLAITDSAGGNNQIPLTMQVTSGIVPPTISPTSATVSIGKQQQFTTNFVNTQSWTTNAGSVSVSGLFTAQNTAGLGTVTITNTLGGGSAFATVTITSALIANPTSFNFGGVLVGSQVTGQFVLKNTNSVPLNISSMSVSGSTFSINTTLSTCKTGGALVAQASCFLTINFLPTSATSFTGTVTVTDSAKGVVSLPLSGTGQVPSAVTVSPTSYAWGNVKTGTTSNATFTVSNLGQVPVVVSTLTVTGTGFSSATSTCFNGITLGPQASCTEVVTFAPVSAIAYSGNLAVVDNSPHTTNLALSGTGTTPPTIAGFTIRNLKIKGQFTIR